MNPGQLAGMCGLPDRLIQHGTREEMLADAGLTSKGLLALVRGLGRHQRRALPKTARAS